MITKFLPDFVYGSIDGIITTFAIVAGSIGANLHYTIILILGLSNVLADGFSMATSRYLSAEAEEEALGEPRDPSPMSSAVATFISFVIMGMIPLTAFIFGHMMGKGGRYYWLAYLFTGIALFLVGYIKGFVIDRTVNIPKETGALEGGLETLFIGGIASLLSYYVALALQDIHPRNS